PGHGPRRWAPYHQCLDSAPSQPALAGFSLSARGFTPGHAPAAYPQTSRQTPLLPATQHDAGALTPPASSIFGRPPSHPDTVPPANARRSAGGGRVLHQPQQVEDGDGAAAAEVDARDAGGEGADDLVVDGPGQGSRLVGGHGAVPAVAQQHGLVPLGDGRRGFDLDHRLIHADATTD